MQELIDRITAKIGIDEDIANKSVGMILGYVQRMGDDSVVGNLIEKIPGAADLIAEHGEIEAPAEGASSGGGIMGMVMGLVAKVTGGGDSEGVMAIGQNLMANGLDMSQIKNVASETIAYAKEQAGEDTVDAITSKIPGLSAIL